MRIPIYLIIASALLLPLQAAAQGGGVSGSGSGSAGATTGTAGSNAGSSGTTGSAGGTGSMPGPPGTNSLGTAQSSGGGVTTGSATASTAIDQRIQDENRQIDQKLKGICRGC
jgi:hypothetical protein